MCQVGRWPCSRKYILASWVVAFAFFEFLNVYPVPHSITPQEVLLWKEFGRISKSLDSIAAKSSEASIKWAVDEANDWAETSLMNQKVVDSLMKSIANGGATIDI